MAEGNRYQSSTLNLANVIPFSVSGWWQCVRSLTQTAVDCVWPAVTVTRADVEGRPVQAAYLLNALRPVMARPTTRVLISLVPS